MTVSNSYILGIDTGGTYTDAVIIDQRKHTIVESAKAITTKGDLSVGVAEAIAAVLRGEKGKEARGNISLIAVSTTLATNAVVEGHGSPVGVVLVGFDDGMAERTGIARAFPGIPIVRAAGGHNHNGEEVEPLDLVPIVAACKACVTSVSAYVVASAFAVRNNSHEIIVRDAIVEATGKPVTLSTEISTSLDAPRRALTATLNARLISRISHLIEAVNSAAKSLGLSCPVMIVKGDGSLAHAAVVASRPIETILSGPAASLIGAKWLSGLDDFILSDMGGTTTDVGVLQNGRPKLAGEGASVGGWRTMVKAIDIKTIGLGGDSEVHIGMNGALSIGPSRALPVSLLAHRCPELVAMLEADLASTEGGSLLGKFLVLPFGAQAMKSELDLTSLEQSTLEAISARPLALRKIATVSSAQRVVQSLRRKGLLQYCAFTPSDAAHALRKQSNWSVDAAVIAAKIATRQRTMKMPDEAAMEAFCQDVLDKTISMSAHVILDTALGDNASDALVAAVSEGRHMQGLAHVMITPQVPIVAVGGPVRVYYPTVAERLGCEVVFPVYCDVANAVGAAAGQVNTVVEATVEGDGQGHFRVHVDGQTYLHGSGRLALADAVERAEASARASSLRQGALDPRVAHVVSKQLLPDAQDDDGLLSALVRAEAMGRPAS